MKKKMTQKQWEKFQDKCEDRIPCDCSDCMTGNHCNNDNTQEGTCYLVEECPKLNKIK